MSVPSRPSFCAFASSRNTGIFFFVSFATDRASEASPAHCHWQFNFLCEKRRLPGAELLPASFPWPHPCFLPCLNKQQAPRALLPQEASSPALLSKWQWRRFLLFAHCCCLCSSPSLARRQAVSSHPRV